MCSGSGERVRAEEEEEIEKPRQCEIERASKLMLCVFIVVLSGVVRRIGQYLLDIYHVVWKLSAFWDKCRMSQNNAIHSFRTFVYLFMRNVNAFDACCVACWQRILCRHNSYAWTSVRFQIYRMSVIISQRFGHCLMPPNATFSLHVYVSTISLLMYSDGFFFRSSSFTAPKERIVISISIEHKYLINLDSIHGGFVFLCFYHSILYCAGSSDEIIKFHLSSGK